MRLCVIGTGYVGLVAGACFADSGNTVVCVDCDSDKIVRLNRGEVPIYEPGLREIIAKSVTEQRLSFTTDIADGIRRAQIIFIAVGTPEGEDGSADLRHVMAVARDIGRHMNGYKIIVDKSTVPVGTAEKVQATIRRHTKHEFDVVSNPEFLKEGAAIDDFMRPDRVVIGTDKKKVGETMRELYAPFVRTGNPILVMDIRSAEMTKYVANAMLATKISFSNEMANLCERLGADISAVRQGISADRRIGPHFIFPGTGYGGSCFPKDVSALSRMGHQEGVNLAIIDAVSAVNERQKAVLIDKVKTHFRGKLRGKRFAIWGLAFKPRTDDMREAPAVIIINALLRAGAKVAAHDPEAQAVAQRIFGNRIICCDNQYDALAGADALLIVTEWNEFRRPDFARMKKLLRRPVIFDGRNIYDYPVMRKHGFTYYSVGRQPLRPAR